MKFLRPLIKSINAIETRALSISIGALSLFLIGCDQQISDFVTLNRPKSISASKGLDSPSTLTLVAPSSSPGTLTTPTIRVAGVALGNLVELYTDSSCTNLVSSATATSTSVDLAVTTALGDGLYHFYAKSSDTSLSSACSSNSVQYIVDTTTAVVSMAARTKVVNELTASTSVLVTMTPSKPYDVTLGLSLYGTTAALGTQFQMATRSVTIPAGQTSASVPITILNNGAVNSESVIHVSLVSGYSSAVNLGSSLATRIEIVDASAVYASVVKYVNNTYMSCALLSNGVAKCWGDYPGDGSTNKTKPVAIDSGVFYADLDVTYDAACGITTTGDLRCWGSNGTGGGASATTPLLVPTTVGTGFSKLSLAKVGYGGCAIKTNNALYCWGTNSDGRIGNGNTTTQLSPVLVDSGTGYIQVITGQNHSCGITTLGALKCWGKNTEGQIGDTTISTNRLLPTLVDVGTNYVLVSSDTYTTCAITTTGVLKCWGRNNNGQLANSGTTNNPVPTVVDPGTNYSLVDVTTTVCGLTTSYNVKCWGLNTMGYVGDGTSVMKTTPTLIDSSSQYSFVTTNGNTSCGILLATGFVKCWGLYAGHDYLGAAAYEPVLIASPLSIAKIFQGYSINALVSTIGDLVLWGSNLSGQGFNYTPTALDPDTRYSEIAEQCRIDTSGGLWCAGPLENVAATISFVRVNPTETFSKVATYYSNYCAITTDGKLKCWGTNGSGHVGNGTQTDQRTPLEIDPGHTYKAVSLGPISTCAIRTTGELYCWGSPSTYHSLGTGSTADSLTPTLIDSGVSYDSISVDLHACGITSTGALRCWGYNQRGQVGNGTFVVQPTPTTIASGTSFIDVKAIDRHTCAITSTNALKCWGRNFDNEVGDGTSTNRSSPVNVDSTESYKAIGVGKNTTTCAITTSNITKCWGSNDLGTMGTSAVLGSDVPVTITSDPTLKSIAIGNGVSCGLTTAGELYCWGAYPFHYEYGFGTSIFFPEVRLPGLQVY